MNYTEIKKLVKLGNSRAIVIPQHMMILLGWKPSQRILIDCVKTEEGPALRLRNADQLVEKK